MKTKIILLSLALLAVSCSSDIFSVNGVHGNASGGIGHEMIELGKQLEDPYTVENMTKALAALYPTKADVAKVDATDLYVRFLPKDEDEYKVLESLGLTLLDHPMDYEIVREGDYYHDPGVDESDITWQYSVVPADFSFPKGIKYELLDDCYISEHDPSTKADGIDWTAVERESFKLTGNSAMLEERTKAEWVQPHGRITIEDEKYDTEPFGVKGVRVSCNVFVKIANAFTDDEGYYKINTYFSASPRYRLVFKNIKGFALGMNLILVPSSISTLGKSGPEGCSVNINASSERKLFSRCVVNNAGYDYFNACSENGEKMKTPPSNLRLWLFQTFNMSLPAMMQQGALIDGSKLADFMGPIYTAIVKMFLPDVILGLKGLDDYSSIYAAALHQFAHGSHLSQVGASWWTNLVTFDVMSFITSGGIAYGSGTETNSNYCEIGEMWAYYAQTVLYRERYPDSPESFGTEHWFSPQVCLYLDERGLNRFKLFKAFTSDVTSRDLLQTKLLGLYPESKSVINQAFNRYN